MKLLKFIGTWILHFIAIIIIAYAFLPFIKWYINHLPMLGVDFYNTATLSSFFRDNLQVLPSSYLYFWHSGAPAFSNVIFIWYQIVGVVARFFPLIESIQYLMLTSFFILLVFTYACAYKLSGQPLFSAALASLVAFSINMYGCLVWGGSMPYFANQLFFPLIIFLLISYITSGNKRWYWMAIFATGISILGHMVNAGSFVLPAAILILFIGERIKPISFKHKISEVFVFFSLSCLMGLRLTQTILLSIWRGLITGRIVNPFDFGRSSLYDYRSADMQIKVDPAIVAFEHSRPTTLFSDTSIWLFYLFIICVVIFLLALIIGKNRRKMWGVTVWIILLAYSTLHVYLNAYGYSFLPQGWYRAYWHFPITLSLASAALAGYGLKALSERINLSKYIMSIIISIISIYGLFFVYTNHTASFFTQMEMRSAPSSAYPQVLNLIRNTNDLNKIKLQLTPQFIDPNQENYRIFFSDQLINIWWNSLFKMPVARGYLDPVTGSGHQGHNFLLEQSIEGDGLVKNYKYTEDTAHNMARYFIDWYGVKYFEGGHASESEVKPLSSYLTNDIEQTAEVTTKGSYSIYDNPPSRPIINKDGIQKLNYVSFKDELVGPILTGTTSPAVLNIGDWIGYESLTKILSMNNLNTRYLITAFSQNNLDTFTSSDYKNFDLIILSNYHYQNKTVVFSRLLEYVKNGGKVIIDTGGETSDAQSTNLPEIFPFTALERKGLGMNWSLQYDHSDQLLSGIDVSAFSAPVFDNMEWKISYPKDTLKKDAKIILSQGDKPILVTRQIGKGTVIWSGLNLAYHVHYNTNTEESKFYVNLLKSLILLEEKSLILGEAKFENQQKASFSVNAPVKGILYKAEFFDNWNISLNGKNVKAYAAGPTFPGFIYVPVSNKGSVQAGFSYIGNFTNYAIWLFSWFISLSLLDLTLFNGWFIGKRIKFILRETRHIMSGWWEKEE